MRKKNKTKDVFDGFSNFFLNQNYHIIFFPCDKKKKPLRTKKTIARRRKLLN